MNKNLIYYTIGFNDKFIDCLELSIKTLNKILKCV